MSVFAIIAVTLTQIIRVCRKGGKTSPGFVDFGLMSDLRKAAPEGGMRKDSPVASRLRGGFLRLVVWGTQSCGLRAAWVKLGIDLRVIKNFWKNHAPP